MKLTQSRLAEALFISQSAVSQLAKQGMPTNSVEAARAWRAANLAPARVKTDPNLVRLGSGPPQLAALLQEAEAHLDVGADLAPLLPDLRAALRRVPADQRAAVAMSADLWQVLTEHIAHAFEDCPSEDLEDSAAQEIGNFWYSMAAGEPWTP
ncbi:MAG: hypothetical protein EKK71_04335 [Candidatus Competibacteraceae bacterium]|nr:MAG: hypothetical protein EKK71_04335 [Candidatus Competibacteraceae bacterium]